MKGNYLDYKLCKGTFDVPLVTLVTDVLLVDLDELSKTKKQGGRNRSEMQPKVGLGIMICISLFFL